MKINCKKIWVDLMNEAWSKCLHRILNFPVLGGPSPSEVSHESCRTWGDLPMDSRVFPTGHYPVFFLSYY